MTAAIAAKHNLKLWRIDFVGAYLNSLTMEDIYMKQPEGFVEPGFEDHVCKLVHMIYGTMQGAHDWYETLSATYDRLSYITSRADPCVKYKREGDGYTLTDTYMDDVFGASKTDEEIEKRKDEMGKEWEIKDVGDRFNRIWMQGRLGSPNDRTGSTSSTSSIFNMFTQEMFPFWWVLSWTTVCLLRQIPRNIRWPTNHTDQFSGQSCGANSLLDLIYRLRFRIWLGSNLILGYHIGTLLCTL